MTAQTPAPKASSDSTLLASFSSAPSAPEPSVKEDFSAVMQQALDGGADAPDHAPATEPTQDKAPARASFVGDPTLASLLLGLLSPPLATLVKQTSGKSSVPSDSGTHSAPEKTSATEAATDPTLTSLLLALLAPPEPSLPKTASHKSAAPASPVAPAATQAKAAPGSAQAASEAKSGKADAAEKTPLLAALTPLTKEAESKGTPTSGTSAASTDQRMSILSERNEIAGRTEQKLPPPGISAVSSADTGGASGDGGAKSSLSFSWHEAPSEPLAIVDISAKAAGVMAPVAPVAETTVDAPARAGSSAPLERLEQMISREAVNVRQTGAQTLGVTLKLDANTQLFLQLTTNNGMVQASVRCDRGSFAPEDAQWAQLQQSLARQNVELLPMTGGSSLNFQQPSQERSRQQAAREEWPAAADVVPAAQPRQQPKEQNRSRNKWESWA